MEDCIISNREDKIIRTINRKCKFTKHSLGVVLFQQMKKYQDNIAQIEPMTGKSNKYGELLQDSIRTAIELNNYGIQEDDIICICSPNHLKACVPYLAALFLGAQASALDPVLSLQDMTHLLKQVPPKVIFTSEESNQTLKDVIKHLCLESTKIVVFESPEFNNFLAPKPNENDFTPKEVNVSKTAVIFFSSGTTGLPKGICVSHYSLLAQSPIFQEIGFDSDVVLGFASLYWVSTVNILISAILYGQTRLLYQNFNAEHVWYSIEKYRITMILMSPTQASFLMKSDRPKNLDLSSLEQITVGGAPVPLELFMELKHAFPKAQIVQGYGWTENGGIVTYSSPKNPKDLALLKTKPRSCGRPLPGICYKIVDLENERPLGPNQKGELRLKSDFQMNGYYNMDSSNAWDTEGWLKTGDICYYDEDYCFYVVDRIKELIKYRGWHVSPILLESILLKHPAVKTAAVIGIPHAEDNEHPMALVELRNDANIYVSEEEIQKFVDDQVDDNKKLRSGVRIIKNIPLTSAGKIKRYDLKLKVLSSNYDKEN